ncbi:MAG TPA: ABC transporter substrate-binding protein [Thermomicrobiales bacterium]|nr:ABC transporter substrate-binding protein [Thermomicrobiales bacterium]
MSDLRFIPTPANKLMQDAITGRATRRELIKRGSALGLSAVLMDKILFANSVGAAAASQASPSADQPVGWSMEKPEWLDVDLSGQTINAMFGSDGPGAPYDQAMCDKFAEWTGATVNYLKGAESATDRLTYMTQALSAGSSDFDVAQIDVIWPGIMNQWAEDLSQEAQELAEAGSTFFERILDNNTIDGKVVSLPFFTDAGVFYYRTDLLEKYGFSAAPVTWTELEEMAQTIIDGESAENSAFTGYTFQAAAYEGLTCNGLEWQYSQGGGVIVDPDGTVTVNNEQAVAAIERAASWVGTIAPSAVTGYMEEDSRGVWQGGNCAFHRNWPYVYSISAADDSDLQGKFDLTLIPAGDGEGGQHAATLGGWNTFVPTSAANVEGGRLFAKWVGSAEQQFSRAIERSQNPTIKEVYERPEVTEVNPFMENLYDVFAEGSVGRPSSVAQDLYGELSIAYFTKVNEILTGQHDDVAAAMEDLAGELDDIMQDV